MREQLIKAGSLVSYEEMNAGHGSFLIGKDMSVWKNKILPMVEEANERPEQLQAR